MRDFYFRNSGTASSHVSPGRFFFKFTGAADVEADGLTLNEGKEVVSAVTRTAEGITKIALKKPCARAKLDLCHSLADVMPYVSTSDAGDGNDPYIAITWRNFSNPASIADADPDAVVCYARLTVDTWRGA